MLRSLISFSAHAVILSTTLAGIQRCSGHRFKVDMIKIPGLRSLCDGFLDLGDFCLNYAVGFVEKSDLFVKKL